ncbi:rhomboid family intramembrane serine protease [Pirellulaceae bacterium SH449]
MIPISTDAPLYHYPIATVTIMVLNVLVFLGVGLNPEIEIVERESSKHRSSQTSPHDQSEQPKGWNDVLRDEESGQQRSDGPGDFNDADDEFFFDPERSTVRTGFLHRNLCLQFGTFKPWQWVTCNFMHADWFHLIGNLIFLWAFGIIVEGKVGWLVFLGIYLGVGALFGFFLQMSTLIFGMNEGVALGASAAIFGLLAICVAWAPANEFETLFFGIRGGTVELSILTYGAFFFAKEVIFLGLQGFRMSSELLHIMGFLVAFPVGLWMVKAGHVDCEGWDLFSYLQGNTGKDSKVVKQTERLKREKRQQQKQLAATASPPQQTNVAQFQSQVAEALDRGEFELAHRLHLKLAANNPSIQWKQDELHQIISGYLKSKRYNEAADLIQVYLERFDHDSFAMQVALLRIWLSQQRPRKVLKYVKGMNVAFLGPEHTAKLKPIVEHAKKLIESGVVELHD